MDKSAIKKVLAKQIKVVIAVDKSMASDRWKRAKAFSEMHSMVVWPKSPYGTFRKFIAAEFPDTAAASAHCWAINYNQMRKWYTWQQIQSMAKSISYSRAVRMQQEMVGKPKISLSKFIQLAKKCNRDYIKKGIKIPNENKVVLSLPVLYVEKLEGMLVPYGYTIPRSKQDPKMGISDAMVKYLDTV